MPFSIGLLTSTDVTQLVEGSDRPPDAHCSVFFLFACSQFIVNVLFT